MKNDGKLKILQIVVAPDNSTYQGELLGLGSDGVIYSARPSMVWEEYFPNRFKDEIKEEKNDKS
jgi:hypothetical protein